MTNLNLRWLAGFTAVYLFLLPTNHGTFLRSIAFGGTMLFAVCASAGACASAAGSPDARIPLPPWSVTLTLAAWFAWSRAVLVLVGQAALHGGSAVAGSRRERSW